MTSGDWVDVENWFSTNTPDSSDGVVLYATTQHEASKTDDISLPLKSRSIESRIDADIGVTETTETFKYFCDADCTAHFRFPLPPKSAVHKFQAEVDNQVIRTVTKKKERAQAEYSTAVSQGHTAVLLEQKSTDIFSIKLGNLPAQTTCTIRISYLALLEKVDDTVEYLHTSTWVPPYTRFSDSAEEVKETTPAFVDKVSYDVSYKVSIHCKAGVKGVETSDEVHQQNLDDAFIVEQTAAVSDPSRDFQLLIQLKTPEKTQPASGSLVLQERTLNNGEKKTVVKATFVPTGPPLLDSELKKEMWLVVDCSGSMSGSPMEQAREAALYFVKDLPVNTGTNFNIVAFGSNHRFLYDGGCRKYDSTTQAEAVKWIQETLFADMGGTEILETMRAIYNIPVTKGCDRQIIFLTDGGIYGSQEEEIYNLVRQSVPAKQGFSQKLSSAMKSFTSPRSSRAGGGESGAHTAMASTQIFCLGIGSGVHRGLLEGMASRTNGIAQYVNNDENIARKTGLLKKCALGSGMMQHPKLVPRGCVVNMVPAVLPPVLFPGQPFTVLAEVVQADPKASFKLTANLVGGNSWSQELKLSDAARSDGDMLHVLHAMGYVNELLQESSHLHVDQNGEVKTRGATGRELESVVEEEVVRVAVAENLVTKYTATVGVLCQLDPLDPSKVQEVDIPIQCPAGRTLFKPTQEADYNMMHRSVRQIQANVSQLHQSNLVSFQSGIVARQYDMQSIQCKSASRSNSLFKTLSSAVGWSRHTNDPTNLDTEKHSGIAYNVDSGMARSSAIQPHCPPPGLFYKATLDASPHAETRSAGPPGGSAEGSTRTLAADCLLDLDEDRCVETESDATNSLKGVACREAMAETRHSPVVSKSKKKSLAYPSASPLETLSVAKEAALMRYSSPPASSVSPVAATPAEALRVLNLERAAEGYWSWKVELGEMLLAAGKASGKAKTAADLVAAKPAELGDDQWATLLVVAFLRKHLAQEKGLWEAMAQKADTWLQGGWPETASSRAGMILTAMKLL